MTLLGQRTGDPDLVRCVDETEVGGPVSFVEQPVTFEPPAPSYGVTLEEWQRREAAAHLAGAPSGAIAGAAGREGRGPAAVVLPVPHEKSSTGRSSTSGPHHQNTP